MPWEAGVWDHDVRRRDAASYGHGLANPHTSGPRTTSSYCVLTATVGSVKFVSITALNRTLRWAVLLVNVRIWRGLRGQRAERMRQFDSRRRLYEGCAVGSSSSRHDRELDEGRHSAARCRCRRTDHEASVAQGICTAHL